MAFIPAALPISAGFSSSIKSEIEGIYGVLPYVAPEVLSRQSSFTQASDIYSFGIIMIEISVGQRPFDGVPFDKVLAARIWFELRPKFALETPNCYIELAMQCLDPDPQKRPTASVITGNLINGWTPSTFLLPYKILKLEQLNNNLWKPIR
ncbi:kinase-like domain-containing protein [Gigaspora rosea]|uniref:Kinase-like domain-containing protein n=1 Tax=Gigaspora rosea TaxID=44941 RepID=A0A397V4A4_9GLOM|nr:kinase-like domain-containing protein [Gigaspora rosea]